jgi:hypothetical protein
MGDDNKIRDAADAVRGIVESVPVYEDAVRPAAKEIGVALQTVAKTVHIALAPVSVMLWGYEQIKDYLEQRLTEKLKDVPPELVIPPNPAVAGPAVESLRFTAQEPSLRELYASLVATAMDARTAHDAHPAFVEIIRQLNPNEARLLPALWNEAISPLITLVGEFYSTEEKRRVRWNFLTHFSLLPEKVTLPTPPLFNHYLDNFRRLGLVDIIDQPLTDESYAPLMQHPSFIFSLKDIERREQSRSEIIKQHLRVTFFGSQFLNTCLEPHRAE